MLLTQGRPCLLLGAAGRPWAELPSAHSQALSPPRAASALASADCWLPGVVLKLKLKIAEEMGPALVNAATSWWLLPKAAHTASLRLRDSCLLPHGNWLSLSPVEVAGKDWRYSTDRGRLRAKSYDRCGRTKAVNTLFEIYNF